LDSNLTFYAIFDQHNGLGKERRLEAPTDLLIRPLFLNGRSFKIIISASANNDDQPVTKDVDTSFPFVKGLEPNELATWRAKCAFFVNEPSALDDLTELTRNIPLELYRVLKSFKDYSPSTPPHSARFCTRTEAPDCSTSIWATTNTCEIAAQCPLTSPMASLNTSACSTWPTVFLCPKMTEWSLIDNFSSCHPHHNNLVSFSLLFRWP
jgi:hypothetical protein